MIQKVMPGSRSGSTGIPASKSRAHRLLICAALGNRKVTIICQGISRDIEATMNCLRAMGCGIAREGSRIQVRPAERNPEKSVLLCCGESGSTLRFLLPVAGALGLEGVFRMEGRLPERPLQPLWDLLQRQGMNLRREGDLLHFSGRLRSGDYAIPGNISSQYVSGLLFALPLLEAESRLRVTGTVESADYIAMTEDALTLFGIPYEKTGNEYRIPPWNKDFGNRGIPALLEVEADWSSAAFFLAMGALSAKGVTARNLNPESRQGDRRILDLLKAFGAQVSEGENSVAVRKGELRGLRIDASAIPDLVPVLATVATAAEGETVIDHAERLRLKESDRLQTTAEMLRSLGAEIRETEDGLLIRGKGKLRGGRVSSFQDHRIAMSAAVAASVCQEPVIIEDAECTDKSFPGFWEKLNALEMI